MLRYKEIPVVLIGHSIGSYMCLNMLNNRLHRASSDNPQTINHPEELMENKATPNIRVISLFPALADMVNTPNGRWIQVY